MLAGMRCPAWRAMPISTAPPIASRAAPTPSGLAAGGAERAGRARGAEQDGGDEHLAHGAALGQLRLDGVHPQIVTQCDSHGGTDAPRPCLDRRRAGRRAALPDPHRRPAARLAPQRGRAGRRLRRRAATRCAPRSASSRATACWCTSRTAACACRCRPRPRARICTATGRRSSSARSASRSPTARRSPASASRSPCSSGCPPTSRGTASRSRTTPSTPRSWTRRASRRLSAAYAALQGELLFFVDAHPAPSTPCRR